MFPITRDRKEYPVMITGPLSGKLSLFPAGVWLLPLAPWERESCEIIRSVGEMIDGGLQISPHDCTRKWCSSLSKWQRADLLLWFARKKKGLKWGSFRNGRNLFFILPVLHTVSEGCRDISHLLRLLKRLVLSQSGIQRHHSLTAFLQQDWGKDSNKLQDVLQLSGRAITWNISFLQGLINVPVQFKCFVQL